MHITVCAFSDFDVVQFIFIHNLLNATLSSHFWLEEHRMQTFIIIQMKYPSEACHTISPAYGLK